MRIEVTNDKIIILIIAKPAFCIKIRQFYTILPRLFLDKKIYNDIIIDTVFVLSNKTRSKEAIVLHISCVFYFSLHVDFAYDNAKIVK